MIIKCDSQLRNIHVYITIDLHIAILIGTSNNTTSSQFPIVVVSLLLQLNEVNY